MDPVIAVFKEDFDRFFALMEKQVDLCPANLWHSKADTWFFWQHVFHTLVCDQIYAEPAGAGEWTQQQSRAVAMLMEEPSEAMSKQAITALAADIKPRVEAYFASLTVADLTARHEGLSKLLGKDRTHQHALIALSRHCCYHMGCLDAALRNNGVAGVY